MHTFTALAALAATATALPAAIPAGGPQGPISYEPGTVLQIAVLQPSGNDYLASNYTAVPSNSAAYIKTYEGDATPPLNFVTANQTDPYGYTGIQMQEFGYGLQLTDSGVSVIQGAGMSDFYLKDGILYNEDAPQGFYYCNEDSPSLGQRGVGRVSYEIGGVVPEGCFAAAFVAINAPK